MRMANKVAIVSGGARGIGRTTAELFAKEGARVYLGDLSNDKPFESDAISYHELNVTELESWRVGWRSSIWLSRKKRASMFSSITPAWSSRMRG
jgi:NAD(P)-dependent dehydrogenase (short-subunit alcohol dehydrogenase family)